MNQGHQHNFVLAIYPNSRGFAFAAFESALSPFDWGVKEIRGRDRNQQCLTAIVTILSRLQPAAVVLQDTSDQGTRRVRRIRNLNAQIATLRKNERYQLSFSHVVASATYSGAPPPLKKRLRRQLPDIFQLLSGTCRQPANLG